MTSTLDKSARRAAVLIGAVAIPLLVAGPAAADVPEGWSDPEQVGALEFLLVLVGLPLLLVVGIAAAVYVPAMARGERVTPGAPPAEDQWFGGPRGGTREIESSSPTDDTGGASGRW